METGCSSDNAALNEPASLSSLARHNNPVPSIFQLPAELVTKIFQSTLPSVDMLGPVERQLLSYMEMLDTIRLIAKRSHEIVDSTPAFWKFIVCTRPPHANEATIARSKNGPLTVFYPYSELYHGRPRITPEDFLGSFAHTFPRWSAYNGPLVSGYFHTPAPHLRTIVLWPVPGATSNGALDLLGGSAQHLRHVDLSSIPIRWRTGLFAQLKVLKLLPGFDGDFELTTTHLLETLRASPSLEHLEFDRMQGPVDHPPSSPVITLPHLRYINICYCDHNFAGAILRRIRAPSCTQLLVNQVVANVQDLPIFLKEDLRNFKELLRWINSQHGFSGITLDEEEFRWSSFPKTDAEHSPWFSVFVSCDGGDVPFIEWVEDLLQDNHGLTISFSFRYITTQEVLESIKSMRCVTRLEIRWSDDGSLRTLEFIGEPLSTDPPSPPLPCLQELLLTDEEWPLQSVLDMVRSRFNPSLWESTERTPLTIKMRQMASLPQRLMFDLTTLTNIRKTDGVESFQFLGSEKRDGTLAITWDEKKSTPVFG